jgi:hypothetical protein
MSTVAKCWSRRERTPEIKAMEEARDERNLRTMRPKEAGKLYLYLSKRPGFKS